MNARLNNLIRRVRADKKKFGAMLFLAVVGLLLWGRLLLKDVPRTADADPAPANNVEPPDKSSVEPVRIHKMPTITIDLPGTLQRDLFLSEHAGATSDRVPAQEKSPEGTTDKKAQVQAVLDIAESAHIRTAECGEWPESSGSDQQPGIETE